MDTHVLSPFPQVPVTPEGEEFCTGCAITAPQSQMTFREHFGGFWMCRDEIACEIRTHLAICSSVLIKHNRFCVYCMAGTMRRAERLRRIAGAL